MLGKQQWEQYAWRLVKFEMVASTWSRPATTKHLQTKVIK